MDNPHFDVQSQAAGQLLAFWLTVGEIGRVRFPPDAGVRHHRREFVAAYAACGWSLAEIRAIARTIRLAGFFDGRRRAAGPAAGCSAFAAGTHDCTNVVHLADYRR